MGEGFGSLPILISFFFIRCYRYDKRGIVFRLYENLAGQTATTGERGTYENSIERDIKM